MLLFRKHFYQMHAIKRILALARLLLKFNKLKVEFFAIKSININSTGSWSVFNLRTRPGPARPDPDVIHCYPFCYIVVLRARRYAHLTILASGVGFRFGFRLSISISIYDIGCRFWVIDYDLLIFYFDLHCWILMLILDVDNRFSNHDFGFRLPILDID